MQDKLEWIDSGNSLPLIRKDSTTHMHGLAVYEKEGLPFAQDFPFKNSADSYLCFWLVLLHSVSHFFFLYQSPSLYYAQFLIIFYLWKCLSSDTSTSIIRTGWPIPVELIDLVNCYNLSISNLSTMVSPPLGNSDHVVVSVFNDFPSNSPKQNALFHHIAYDYSCADWDGLCDHLRMFHGRVSLNSSLLLLLVIIVSEFRLEFMDISLIVIIRSSLTHLYGFQLYMLVP